MPPSLSGGLVWEHLIAVVLGVYPAIYLAVLCHEIGHAIVGRLSGFTVTSLGLGTHHPFFKVRLPGGVLFYLCRDNPLLGICWAFQNDQLRTHRSYVPLLLGGAIMNLLLVVPSALLWRVTHGGFWLVFATINLIVGITNLIPYTQQLRGASNLHASDGLQAVKYLVARYSRTMSPRSFLTYRSLWEAVGDHRAFRHYLCSAAMATLILKDTKSAGEYISIAEGLPPDENDTCVLMLRGACRTLLQDKSAGRADLEKAKSQFAGNQQQGNLFYANMFSYDAYDDATQALTDMEQMAVCLPASMAHNPTVVMTLAAERLLLFFRQDSDDAVILETYIARFEASRRAMRSDVTDADVYTGIAQWRQKHGDSAGARIAWEQALKAIDAINTALADDKELQGRYQERINAQLTEAGVLSPFAANPLSNIKG